MSKNSHQSPQSKRNSGKDPYHHNSPVKTTQKAGPKHGQGPGQPDPFRHLNER